MLPLYGAANTSYDYDAFPARVQHTRFYRYIFLLVPGVPVPAIQQTREGVALMLPLSRRVYKKKAMLLLRLIIIHP